MKQMTAEDNQIDKPKRRKSKISEQISLIEKNDDLSSFKNYEVLVSNFRWKTKNYLYSNKKN